MSWRPGQTRSSTRRLEEIANFNALIESVDLDALFDTEDLDTLLGAEFASRFGPAVRGQGPFGDDDRRIRGDGISVRATRREYRFSQLRR